MTKNNDHKKSTDDLDQKSQVVTTFADMEKIQDPEPNVESLEMESHSTSVKEQSYSPSTYTATNNNKRSNESRAFNAYMLFCTLVVGLGGLNWGYENALVGPISAMKAFVRDMQGINKDTGLYVLSASHQSIIFSVPLTGTVVGALLTTPVQDRFGRKYALIGSYTTSMGAVFLQLFAPNFVAFVCGRWWNAVSYGAALAIAPNFMADLVPAKMRGRFVSGANIATIASSVLATVACYIAQSTHGDDQLSYKIPLAVQATLPFLMTIPTFFVCESPSWLLSKGRVQDARKTLRSIRGFSDEEVHKELEILQAVETESRLREKPRYWDIYKKANIRRTLVGGSIFSLNQLSGIILSTTFAAVFLTQLGAGNPFLFSVIGNLCLLLGTIGAPFVLDNFGRRPTALIGFTILLIIDIAAGILAFFAKTNKSAALIIAVLSFIFNIVWTLSFYSISLLMPAEIPSEKMRNATMTHAIGCGQMTAILTTLVVPLITAQDAANLGAKAYLIFAGLMATILVLAFLLLPETKGRTSLEIDELYGRKIPAWRWKGFETSANRLAAQSLQQQQHQQ